MIVVSLFLLVAMLASTTISSAEEKSGGGAAEMARKLQDPLANIKAVMTDNVIGFNTGASEGTSYGFQIQPIYAIDFPDKGFTFLPRGIIPIVGIEPGSRTQLTGEDGNPTPSGDKRVWGLGDSVGQFFFVPKTEKKWKWGVGPQISFATHTDSDLRGSNWGAGAAGVIVGNLTPNISFAGIVGQMWSFDGKFSTAIIQPMLFYNFNSIPGAYVAYNAVSSVNWLAESGDKWTVPLGVSIGRTFDMGGGHGFDAMIGPYYNAARPEGAADWQIRFGLNWMFP
jgi:hypothetical protein